MDRITRQRLAEMVDQTEGIYLDAYNPGDGNRYRFARVPGDYFGWRQSERLYTAVSIRDAYTYVLGFRAGRTL